MMRVQCLLLILSLFFCKPADLNNPADPTSQLYLETLILTSLLQSSLADQDVLFEGTIYGLIPNSNISISVNSNQVISLASLSNGTFSFSARINPNVNYNLSINSQPSQLECSIRSGESGTILSNKVTGLVITCPIAVVGGLKWYRCSHGQTWDEIANSGAGSCTGTAIQQKYCSVGTNDCNGGSDTGILVSSAGWTGGANSSAWSACNALNTSSQGFGITTWRLPNKAELKSIRICNNDLNFGFDTSCPNTPDPIAAPTLNTQLFPNTISALYSSSESNTTTTYWQLNFNNGSVPSGGSKTGNDYLRCVSN
ncbi:MAG: DUF1566 domain-containing protein [Leptospira sp.]|nr:DUF1566 domain-containing protein [Leptospira sp.]